jgi:transcriptional regulator with XRE-family HTH domain
MKANDIKAAIASAGTSQSAIAEFLGLSTTTVSGVVNGKTRSARVEAELAKIIGRPPFGLPARKGRAKTTWNGKAQAVAA